MNNVSLKYYIYALVSSKDGRIYVGMTKDVQNRVSEHNSKKVKSTKGFTPWKIFFYEEVENRLKARELEKYYKSGSGKEKLKEILKNKAP